MSREEAIEILSEMRSEYNLFGDEEEATRYHVLSWAIQEMKATQTERKVGKWMETDAAPHRIYCSECYATFIPNKEWVAWKEGIIPRHYCPMCGARMRGEEDESERRSMGTV